MLEIKISSLSSVTLAATDIIPAAREGSNFK
jgi:hypothetical protein